MKTKLFLTGLALAGMVALSSAQVGTGNGNGNGVCDGTCENFVDANNDGICDNYAEGTYAGNGYRHGLALNQANVSVQGMGQAFRRGQAAPAARNFRYSQANRSGLGRGPAAEGRHLNGPGYRVQDAE